MKVNEAIFRDYDIRGLVGKDLSPEFAYVFGKAFGTFLRQNGFLEALVGYDARETSPKYQEECQKGLLETGIDVIRVGMVTSPMIYWARKFYNINGAVAITASHNPPEYNGFKPCFGGGAMFGEQLQQLKKLMLSEKFTQGQGKVTEKDITEEYVEDIASKVHGIVFDGDADRVGIVDENGEVVRGDLITALCARKILKDKPGSLVDFELQCSRSATDDVVASGGQYKLIRVGHSYIEEALVKDHAELAGETSGHIFFADRWYGFDDAIYAACRFLEYVAETNQTVSELVASMPKYVSTPQTRVSAPDDKKFEIIKELKKYFEQKGEKIIAIDGIRLEWEDGWAVVRASNTQPQLTMRAEATNEKRLSQIKKMIEEALLPYAKDGVVVEWGKVH
ncbi:phosphomannomutase/phosphoglucomutase [Candidatus Curtissbacteria bacterium]|nr:phosphomannomutase/phosphoglucomutase [Candidatus Curtissbacteria bacterium]